jgi:periplasmic divalent cation tolerance protein
MAAAPAVVLVTAGSEAEADRLAHHLVEARLAACVSLLPVRSLYRWRGQVQREAEWQLVIKTDLAQFDALSAAIAQLHSYDVPEIIALPIVAGLPAYLQWLQEEIQPDQSQENRG